MKKKHVQILVGLALSAFFIWYSLRGADMAALVGALKTTNWLLGVPFMLITMGSFYWRCFRWRILLAPAKDIPSHRLYGPLMIGFAFNNIFPARAGEFARPLALTKQEHVPYGAGLSTVFLERLIDVVTLLVLFVLMPFYMTIDPAISESYEIGGRTFLINAQWLDNASHSISIAALVLMAGMFSFLVPPVKRLYLRIITGLPLLPAFVKEKLCGFIEAFTKGFDSLKSARGVAMIVIHSAVIWLSVAFSFLVMSWGFPGVTLQFGQSIAFLVITCVIISIPSSPGFWGLYEFGGMVALLLMGVVPNTEAGRAQALAFTMVVHFLQWVPITAYGLWAAAKLSVRAGEVSAITEQAPAHE